MSCVHVNFRLIELIVWMPQSFPSFHKRWELYFRQFMRLDTSSFSKFGRIFLCLLWSLSLSIQFKKKYLQCLHINKRMKIKVISWFRHHTIDYFFLMGNWFLLICVVHANVNYYYQWNCQIITISGFLVTVNENILF